MSGGGANSPSPHQSNDGGLVTLREYVDVRFKAQEQAVSSALASAERAVAKAEAAAEKRFEAVNEFRASLADQSRLLLQRTEAETVFKALTEKIDVLTARVNSRDDRGRGIGSLAGWVVAGISSLSALALLFAKLSGN